MTACLRYRRRRRRDSTYIHRQGEDALSLFEFSYTVYENSHEVFMKEYTFCLQGSIVLGNWNMSRSCRDDAEAYDYAQTQLERLYSHAVYSISVSCAERYIGRCVLRITCDRVPA